MNKHSYYLILLLMALVTACTSKPPQEATPSENPLVIRQLSNGDVHFILGETFIEALVSPGDGGKLTSLKYRGNEILTSQSTDSLAYGSTFWPAPHDWGWPPAAAIDRAAYATTLEDSVLILEGPVIESMGLKFIKHFSLHPEDSTARFTYQIVNVSDHPVPVAPWEVTRVPKGGFSFFPVEDEYQPFTGVASGIVENLYYCAVSETYAGKPQKINFNANAGWLAHVDNGILLLKTFPDLSASEITPGEGDVEIYIDNDTNYIELENQGPYVKLPPGDSISYSTTWYLGQVDLPPSASHLEQWEQVVLSMLD